MVEFEVSGDKIEAVTMIPGWTHNIINVSETENLVTIMTCIEIFDPKNRTHFLKGCSIDKGKQQSGKRNKNDNRVHKIRTMRG